MSEIKPAVAVAGKNVEAAWRKNGYGEFWLLVKPAPGTELDAAIVDRAAEEATERSDVDGNDEGTVGGAAVPVASGVVVFVSRADDTSSLRAWVTTFASLLSAHGYAGEIKGAPVSRPPSWTEEEVGRYQMSLFVAYTTEGPTTYQKPRGIPWAVPAESTRRIAETSVDWVLRRGGQAYLGLSTYSTRLPNPPAEALTKTAVTSELLRSGRARLRAVQRSTKRVRAAGFTNPGLGQYAYANDAASWRDRLADLLDLVRAYADLIDLAMVRPGPVYALGWQSMEVNGPPMNVPSAWYDRHRDHLRDTVPDAHGVQVLTGAHLDRAHDLSKWDIREIAPDRFLVTAHDLEPWFTTGLADPTTVTTARADFGDMLRWPNA